MGGVFGPSGMRAMQIKHQDGKRARLIPSRVESAPPELYNFGGHIHGEPTMHIDPRDQEPKR